MSRTMDSFCKSTDEIEVATCSSNPDPPSIDSFITGKSAIDAEILWTLKVVKNHLSYNSCQGIGELFHQMFPDSTIAKQFSVGERKCSYMILFGLSPFFKAKISKTLQECEFFTLLFDETLNKSNQKKQLDIHVRFWDPLENEVRTKYFDSAFLGHSTSEDLVSNLYAIVKNFSLPKLLQISMDGPNVNWKFFKTLQSDIEKEFYTKCANVGSCGLHIVNNAFRDGASSTEWNVSSILVSLYWLLKDSPARRDFLETSKSKKMPVKFCNYRWLENVPAADRAILIWDDVKLFIKAIELGKLTKITNKSFLTIVEATKDKLFVAKMAFFASVAKVFEPFLVKYQTDKPILPYYADDIYKIVFNCITLYCQKNLLK